MEFIFAVAVLWFLVWLTYRFLSRLFNTSGYRRRQRRKNWDDIRRDIPPFW